MPITQFPAKGQVMRVESVLKTISTVHGDPPSDYILTAVRTLSDPNIALNWR